MNITNKNIYIKKQPYSNKEYGSLKKNFFKQIECIGKENIISIDESAIYLNSKNNYGWAIKGSKCIIKEKNNKMYQRKYSLLIAISNKKIISYKLYKKNINGEQYLNFIKEIVNDHGNNYTLLTYGQCHYS